MHGSRPTNNGHVAGPQDRDFFELPGAKQYVNELFDIAKATGTDQVVAAAGGNRVGNSAPYKRPQRASVLHRGGPLGPGFT